MSARTLLTQEQKIMMRKSASPDLSILELAKLIGGSYYSVRYYVKILNLPYRGAGSTNKAFSEQKEGTFNVDELEDWIVGGNRYSKYQQSKQNYGR